MFDDGGGARAGDRTRSRPILEAETGVVPPHEDRGWGWFGRPAAGPEPARPDPAAAALVVAVDALLEQSPCMLPGPAALDRTRTVLTQLDRLGVVLGTALLDVEARELFALDAAGSTTGWLRRQPAGDAGRLARSRRLDARPHVRAAVAAGVLGLMAADMVCRVLDALPAATEPGQVEGVLSHAVPELLSRWIAGSVTEGGDELSVARAAVVRDAITAGVAAAASAPAERLEPAFTLLAQALAPGVLTEQLQLLADALQPERLESAEARAHDDRSMRLRKKRSEPGWRLNGDLTDEVGAALQAELEARMRRRREAEAALRRAAAGAGTATGAGVAGDFGTAGPGTPQDEVACDGVCDHLSDEQLAHDLLGELLEDCDGVREAGGPQPATITITAGLDALEGRLGALPGTVLLPGGPASLCLSALRRAGCDGRLNAVLLDAARTPVGASGTHRHATERERRALRATWGTYCAANGCASTRTVPHHVRPWWMTGRTALEDLIPLCKGNHHDVHEGHRVLLLRDGRMIDEFGWAERAGPTRSDPPPAEPASRWDRAP